MSLIVAGFFVYVALAVLAILFETISALAEVVKFFRENKGILVTIYIIFLIGLMVIGAIPIAMWIITIHFLIFLLCKIRESLVVKYLCSVKFNNLVYKAGMFDAIKQYQNNYKQLDRELQNKIKVGDTYFFNFSNESNLGAYYNKDCSLQIVNNAERDSESYVCKYFNIPISLDTVEKLFETGELCMRISDKLVELEDAINSIDTNLYKKIPIIYRGTKSKELMYKQLGIETKKITWKYFTVFVFEYRSPQGKSSKVFKYMLEYEAIARMAEYILSRVETRETSRGQRALMTQKLRKDILERDNYTCQKCGNSIYNEENLLLEVDHIIPVSKGGKTVPENLQTLCWKCNRSKGNKTTGVSETYIEFCNKNTEIAENEKRDDKIGIKDIPKIW